MNLRSAANLIRNEYRERQTAADEAYRRAMEAHPELYAAEKAVRAAVLDGADNVAELERRRDKLAAECGVKRAAPRCAKCGDTGVVGNEYCDCVRRRAARETVGFSAPPFAFGDGDTDVFRARTRRLPTRRTAACAYSARSSRTPRTSTCCSWGARVRARRTSPPA